jgi:hypothetical protein
MTEDTAKCVAVLTRCGAYSRVGAEQLVKTLKGEDVAGLIKMHDGLAQLEQPIPPGQTIDHEGRQKLLAQIGESFRTFLNSLADRQITYPVAKKAKPLVGTGEP